MINQILVNQISQDPYDRLTAEMKKALENPDFRFDVHTHVFDYDHVPNSYFGTRLPISKKFLKKASDFLDKLIDGDDDIASHLAHFIEFLNNNSLQDISKKMFDLYPTNQFAFCILMMDMEYGVEKPAKDFDDQYREMINLKNSFPDKVLPFFAVDPRRPDVKERFIKAFSAPDLFFGVKIYPALGYLPSDPILMEIFEVCEQKNIPITTHCGGYAVHTTHDEIEVRGLKADAQGNYIPFTETKSFGMPKSIGDYFNSPENWIPVLKAFPKLRLNMAHFGGGSEWEIYVKERLEIGRKSDTSVSQIIELMYQYENVYTDFAYTISRPYFYKTLRQLMDDNKVISERVMFGTDFYMVAMEGIFRAIKTEFTTAMGDKLMYKLASENPRRFLFGK